MKEMTAMGLTAEIRKISPKEGDLLVFKVPAHLRDDQMQVVADLLKKTLPAKVCVIFLTPDETLSMTLRDMKDDWLKKIGLQRIPE